MLRSRCSFKEEEIEELLLRHPSNKGLVILDARRDPRSNDVRILVSVCRKQPLCVEGVDPEGALRVRSRAGRRKTSVCVRCAPSRRGLPRRRRPQWRRHGALIRRARRVFSILKSRASENNFVERTIRIRQIAEPRASAVKAELIAAIPAKRGRVT